MELIFLNFAWVSTLLLQSLVTHSGSISRVFLTCEHQVPIHDSRICRVWRQRGRQKYLPRQGPAGPHTGKAGALKHAAPGPSALDPDLEGDPIPPGLAEVRTPDPGHRCCRTIAHAGGSPFPVLS